MPTDSTSVNFFQVSDAHLLSIKPNEIANVIRSMQSVDADAGFIAHTGDMYDRGTPYSTTALNASHHHFRHFWEGDSRPNWTDGSNKDQTRVWREDLGVFTLIGNHDHVCTPGQGGCVEASNDLAFNYLDQRYSGAAVNIDLDKETHNYSFDRQGVRFIFVNEYLGYNGYHQGEDGRNAIDYVDRRVFDAVAQGMKVVLFQHQLREGAECVPNEVLTGVNKLLEYDTSTYLGIFIGHIHGLSHERYKDIWWFRSAISNDHSYNYATVSESDAGISMKVQGYQYPGESGSTAAPSIHTPVTRPRRTGPVLTRIPGEAWDIGAGPNDVWYVSTRGMPYRFNPGPGAGSWDQIQPPSPPFEGPRIAVDNAASGSAWYANGQGYVFSWSNSGWKSRGRPCASINDVGVGNGQAWVICGDKTVHRLDPRDTWTKTDGSGLRIAVDSRGYPLIVTDTDEIQKATSTSSTTAGWSTVGGSGMDVKDITIDSSDRASVVTGAGDIRRHDGAGTGQVDWPVQVNLGKGHLRYIAKQGDATWLVNSFANIYASARRIFVTSAKYRGDIGSTAKADELCQTAAKAAGMGIGFKAWVSDNTSTVATRLGRWTSAYYNVDYSKIIAKNWTGLTSGSLANRIDLTEKGIAVGGDDFRVWTGTGPDGKLAGDHCSQWSTRFAAGMTGDVTRKDMGWTRGGLYSCTNSARIYCVEQ